MVASDTVLAPESSFSNNMLTFEALFLLGACSLLLLGNQTQLVKNLATVFSGIVLEAVPFMLLAAPLVPPIVGVSTAVAYSYSGSVALIRLSLGYAIAVAAGLVMGWLFP